MWKNRLLNMSIVMALSLGALSACSMNADLADEPNIRPSHPVILSPRVMTLPVSVGSKGQISNGDMSKIMDFTAGYYKQGAHEVLITSKATSGSQIAAVKKLLMRQGLRATELKMDTAGSGTKSGKSIELTYRYYIARPSSCGRFTPHPEFNPRNLTDLNLGCSVKANIARMTSSPSDIRSSTVETRQDGRPASRRVRGTLSN